MTRRCRCSQARRVRRKKSPCSMTYSGANSPPSGARRKVRLSLRRAWQVRLDNGMTLEVGREQVAARLTRFLSAYAQTIAPLGGRADHVDLRYANGFAVRVPELAHAKGAAALPHAAPTARPGA